MAISTHEPDTQAVLASQYLAALQMLQQAVQRCPASLWDDATYANRFWQVAYHALFYTHLYLQPSEDDFVPWPGHRADFHAMGSAAAGEEGRAPQPYAVEEVLAYLAFCRQQLGGWLAALDWQAPSGFHWLPMNKLELQFYNLRHLQHHTGELYERLGTAANLELAWIGRG